MKQQLSCSKLLVKKSPIHGYGVFAAEDIKSGQIIEETYVLISKNYDSSLANYYFASATKGESLLPLGWGAIYNHTAFPNADYDFDKEQSLLVFYAIKPIKQGEEIFVSYGDDWFSSRHLKMVTSSRRFKLRRYISSAFFLMRFIAVSSVFFAVSLWLKKS